MTISHATSYNVSFIEVTHAAYVYSRLPARMIEDFVEDLLRSMDAYQKACLIISIFLFILSVVLTEPDTLR